MTTKLLAGLLVAAAGAVWAWALWPEGPPPAIRVEAAAAPADEIHYFCRETKQVTRGPRVPTPAVNPKTGRATLVQALFCKDCCRWLPAPPAEAQGQAIGPRCPKHGTPLQESP